MHPHARSWRANGSLLRKTVARARATGLQSRLYTARETAARFALLSTATGFAKASRESRAATAERQLGETRSISRTIRPTRADVMARYVYSALAYCLAGCVLQNHGLVAAGVWALTYSPMARVLPALTGLKTKAKG